MQNYPRFFDEIHKQEQDAKKAIFHEFRQHTSLYDEDHLMQLMNLITVLETMSNADIIDLLNETEEPPEQIPSNPPV